VKTKISKCDGITSPQVAVWALADQEWMLVASIWFGDKRVIQTEE
jgi:hypothetical protein